jgi:hypothetical protein
MNCYLSVTRKQVWAGKYTAPRSIAGSAYTLLHSHSLLLDLADAKALSCQLFSFYLKLCEEVGKALTDFSSQIQGKNSSVVCKLFLLMRTILARPFAWFLILSAKPLMTSYLVIE